MSFITVKFGDNEEELFNPNCVTMNLMDNIRRRCGCPKGVTLDLSDEDGEMKSLHEFPTQYAHRFLKGREVLVLIKVEKGHGDKPTTYTALLNDLENTNPKLVARLDSLSKSISDSTPKSGNKKESLWSTAAKMRKQRATLSSAGRNRTESNPSLKGDAKTQAGVIPSPQAKARPKKVSKS